MEHFKGILEAKLELYNDKITSINLTLFDMAMEHVRSNERIVDLPFGSALLVGVVREVLVRNLLPSFPPTFSDTMLSESL